MKSPRLLAALAFLTLVSAARAQGAPAARAAIVRYLEASGGRAAFESIHSTRTFETVAALGLKGFTETWSRDPDWRATDTVLGPLKFKEGYDGVTAWRTDPATG